MFGGKLAVNIKVLIADDHDVVRAGIRAIIDKKTKDIEIVGEVSNGREVLKIAKENPADVYVLDISMPMLNGIEVTERLVKMNSGNKVIIFSVYDDKHLVEKALRCGAKGYIVKENATEEIVRAIYEVYKGYFFLCPSISKYVVQGFIGGIGRGNYKKKDSIIKLTPKEREILQLIAEGFSNKEIAEALFVSVCTVRAHRNNIMQKLDIHKQAELIRYAIKEGISQLELFTQKKSQS